MGRKIEDLIIDPVSPGDVVDREDSKDSCTLDILSTRIRTQEQALAKAEIDTDVWEVVRCKVTSWEVGAKGPDNRIVVEPLFGIKLDLQRKKAWDTSEFRNLLLEDYKSLKPVYKKPTRRLRDSGLLGVLCIFDHHFGKLAWAEESGENYDLKIAESRYMKAAEDLLGRLAKQKPEKILYVVGNDFLHVDQGGSNATTRGTVLDCDGRWQKAFRIGLGCAIRTADMCRTIADVDILTVQGNHDAEKIFCLGEALGGRYHDVEGVSVINEPSPEHYYRYGANLLGFVHGDGLNETKKKQLANKMAVDRPEDWAETTSREWFLGHCHREKENIWLFRSADTVQKVVIRECPALCGSDAWHSKNLYMSPLGAELHLYQKETGRYGYLTYSPQE